MKSKQPNHWNKKKKNDFKEIIQKSEYEKQTTESEKQKAEKKKRKKIIKTKLNKPKEKIIYKESCKPDNQVEFSIATLRAHRSEIRIQTSLKFINTENFEDKYLIAIGGNSETFGVNQKIKLHTYLEKKLNKRFNTDKILVINAANLGHQLKDQIITLEYIASDLYPVDLSILYTGGNLIYRDNKILQFISDGKMLNIKNENMFSPLRITKETLACLNKNNFITNKNTNTYKEHSSHKANSYLIRNFKKMKKNFNINKMDYLFFIQPFNPNFNWDAENQKENKKILNSLRNIQILDRRFFNLANAQKFQKGFLSELNFYDNFHTRDLEPIADLIFEKIINLQSEKILNKI